MNGRVDPTFWLGKRVLLTGHTGFKGSWMSLWLLNLGAHVSGLSLAPDSTPNLFALARIGEDITGGICDVCDAAGVAGLVASARPEIVIHMAAQSLVRRSIAAPVDTFAINVLGTVNLLEALRTTQGLKAVLVVTTDKVYENEEMGNAFRESDPLGGHDPYSASKAAAEIVVQSYARTYFEPAGIPLATARGGNVIGGGDFSEDRIVPDIWRAMTLAQPIKLRYPKATRPWQHVLDCVAGYLCFAQALAERRVDARALNFGPDPSDPLTVADIVAAMQSSLGTPTGWVEDVSPKPREMQALALDCRAARSLLGWRDQLPGLAALAATAGWYLALKRNEDMRAVTLRAIEEFQRP